MSHKQGQESLNYVDGIKVKISEKYKPPPRINLVMTYSQRLSLNKQIQDNMPIYDFTLEANVRDKIHEYKLVRKSNIDERMHRLDKVREARKKFEEEQKAEQKKVQNEAGSNTNAASGNAYADTSSDYSNYRPDSNVLIPMQVTTSTPCMNILTPTISSKNACPTTSFKDKSPFNISEFEADTSSPFDNMELKTINDMEELALVLQSDDNTQANVNQQPYTSNYSSSSPYSNYVSSQPTYSYTLPAATQPLSTYVTDNTFNRTNGYYYSAYPSQFDYKVPYTYNNGSFDQDFNGASREDNRTALKSVPDIMKALETELDNTHINHSKKNNYSIGTNYIMDNQNDAGTSYPKVENRLDELENPYSNLPKDQQFLSKNISSMGFPLDRVARACKVLGKDHKKIVEHLLAMTELLDLGFPENKVSNALLQTNNDRDKALDILIL